MARTLLFGLSLLMATAVARAEASAQEVTMTVGDIVTDVQMDWLTTGHHRSFMLLGSGGGRDTSAPTFDPIVVRRTLTLGDLDTRLFGELVDGTVALTLTVSIPHPTNAGETLPIFEIEVEEAQVDEVTISPGYRDGELVEELTFDPTAIVHYRAWWYSAEGTLEDSDEWTWTPPAP